MLSAFGSLALGLLAFGSIAGWYTLADNEYKKLLEQSTYFKRGLESERAGTGCD